MKIDKITAFGYAYIHFAQEVMCFFILYKILYGSGVEWVIIFLYDIFAFALQPVIGAICEKKPKFRPGILGSVLLMIGAGSCLLFSKLLWLYLLGVFILAIGNVLLHISGALATLRVSNGRLSESAIFVGGGSFGVITGRILAGFPSLWWVVYIAMLIGVCFVFFIDKRIKKKYGDDVYNFEDKPCMHDLIKKKDISKVIIILGFIIIGRSFIGYGLPTAWNQTTLQTVFLFVFMGLGKMLGGILSDKFGAGNVGVFSCIGGMIVLIFSNNIMWFSLIGICLFSMTMAITLGGIVSALPYSPGIAFGVTTVALLLGAVPTFFTSMPSRWVCDVLIIVISVFSAIGIAFCMKRKHTYIGQRNN